MAGRYRESGRASLPACWKGEPRAERSEERVVERASGWQGGSVRALGAAGAVLEPQKPQTDTDGRLSLLCFLWFAPQAQQRWTTKTPSAPRGHARTPACARPVILGDLGVLGGGNESA